ncbi:hypothetical protein RhiirA4_462425 [Rhizophagus irregularis]|uniref:Uncharacterized protein n=1 Tax=Rhizophagus irregularis TaxID=588596 RepID=A0A2I1GL55_9GLOM|nr:hypothetical protein RhiirA4_462425 [Rhizophagus irregularis]
MLVYSHSTSPTCGKPSHRYTSQVSRPELVELGKEGKDELFGIRRGTLSDNQLAIIKTVEKHHRELLSTFNIKDTNKLFHFLFLFYESFYSIQQEVAKGFDAACQEFVKKYVTLTQLTTDTSKSVEDQPMEIEILETPKTPKHQSKAAA